MINLFSDDVRRNPYPVYAQMRRASPLLELAPFNAWMVLDYEGVRRVLSDNESFSSRLGPEWMLFVDPPRHSKLRALISRAFTPATIAGLEPRIRRISRELLDRSAAGGEMDLVADYSAPLPMTVIAEMIGVPAADRPEFQRWSDAILNLSYDLTGGESAATALSNFRSVTGEMDAYLAGLIRERRSSPQADLLTRLVNAEVEGERLTPADIRNFVQLLLVAGQETTTNLINLAILCLLENPDQFALLRRRVESMPTVIEEVLRYRSPFQWTPRVTRRDVELHGRTIPAGKRVLAVIGSANRDPRQFNEPDRFDVARNPNPHIAFGHGAHFCLGAPLARLEAGIALTDLIGQCADIEIAGSQPWEPRKALHVHGPASLPIRFRYSASTAPS